MKTVFFIFCVFFSVNCLSSQVTIKQFNIPLPNGMVFKSRVVGTNSIVEVYKYNKKTVSLIWKKYFPMSPPRFENYLSKQKDKVQEKNKGYHQENHVYWVNTGSQLSFFTTLGGALSISTDDPNLGKWFLKKVSKNAL